MKRFLILVNTYYQLILAIHMKNSILQHSSVVVLLSDHSVNSENVYNKLVINNIFDECYYVRSKNFYENRNQFQKFKDCLAIGFGRRNRYKQYISQIKNKKFDEFICYNVCLIEVDGIFSILYSFNKDIVFSLFEEGILSYNVDITKFKQRYLIEKIRKLKGLGNFYNDIFKFYCFFPGIYEGRGIPIEIPMIKKGSFTSLDLKKIFSVENLIYKQKYIFFSSVYDFEGGTPVGEYELVCRIAKLIGKENLLIKTHPRDTRTIYSDNGFNVDNNSSVPWEAIQLSLDFSDKIFMTINSGSVLAGSIMSNEPVTTYYMYKLCNISNNESCKKNARDIEKLLNQNFMKNILKTVKVVDKLEEIL